MYLSLPLAVDKVKLVVPPFLIRRNLMNRIAATIQVLSLIVVVSAAGPKPIQSQREQLPK